jgi:hypothetical protein
MNFLRYFSLTAVIASLFLLSGCSTAQKKQAEVMKVGIHKVNDSLNKGRVDLAKKYSNELVKVVPRPKTVQAVKPIVVKYPDQINPERVIVLPPEFKETKTVVVDTPEFKKLVEENKEIKKQLEVEKKEFDKFQVKVEDTIKSVWKEAEKGKKSSFWSWVWGLGFTGIALLLVGVIFFPSLLPVVISYAKSLINAFISLFKKESS